MAESIGYNTVLQRNSTTVAHVYDITGPELTRDDVEITDYASADGYREYIPGLREPGVIGVMANLVSTDIPLLELFHSSNAATTAGVQGTTNATTGSFNSPNVTTWRLSHTDETDYWDFSGYVNRIAQAQPINDRRTWEIGIKVTGVPQRGIGA